MQQNIKIDSNIPLGPILKNELWNLIGKKVLLSKYS